jgi:hypothetical protein
LSTPSQPTCALVCRSRSTWLRCMVAAAEFKDVDAETDAAASGWP